MNCQFINFSMAARSVSKKAIHRKREGKNSGRAHWPISKIIAEASRAPEASPHVINPLEPILLYGMELSKLEELCYKTAYEGSYENGKKLRKDTPVLLTVVASFPRSIQIADGFKYEKWKHETLSFMLSIYKSYLRSAVEHLDEEHPHIHFFILPPSGRAKDFHPGFIGEKGVKDPKLRKQRHSEGLRKFQDYYSRVVGEPNGLARVGPVRMRVSRKMALIEQNNRKKLADTERACEAIRLKTLASLKHSLSLEALKLMQSEIENELSIPKGHKK